MKKPRAQHWHLSQMTSGERDLLWWGKRGIMVVPFENAALL
jgi:hypothetical protein